MSVLSKSDFARKIDRSHQYVSSLIKKGLIVLTKQDGREMVEVEASMAKIAANADPANNPAVTMPRADGRTKASVGMTIRQNGIPNTETDGSQSSTTMQYQKSRAVKESYAARLRKVEFEEKMGTIVHKEGIEKAFFGELNAVVKYRKILGTMPSGNGYTLLMSIMTDELIHANKYNYLINKLNIVN